MKCPEEANLQTREVDERSREDGERRTTTNGYEVSVRDDAKCWIRVAMTVVRHDECAKTAEPHTLKRATFMVRNYSSVKALFKK